MINITPTTIIYFFLIILGISIILYMMGVFTPNAAPPVEQFGPNGYTRADVKILFISPYEDGMGSGQRITLEKYKEVYKKINDLHEFKEVKWKYTDSNAFKIMFSINDGQVNYISTQNSSYDDILTIIDSKL